MAAKGNNNTWHSQCEVWCLPAWKNHICKLNPQNKWKLIFALHLCACEFSCGWGVGRRSSFRGQCQGSDYTQNKTQSQIRGGLSRVKHRESPVTCRNLQNFRKKSKIEIFALINVTWWKLVARSKYWHRGKYFMPTRAWTTLTTLTASPQLIWGENIKESINFGDRFLTWRLSIFHLLDFNKRLRDKWYQLNILQGNEEKWSRSRLWKY